MKRRISLKRKANKRKCRSSIMQNRRNALAVTIVFAGLALAVFLADRQAALEELKTGIARGSTEDEIQEETYLAKLENGDTLEIPVTVYPRDLTEEEKEAYLAQAVEEFEAGYLGDNVSSEEVCSDLNLLSSYADGMVTAVFESDEPQILWEDGTVSADDTEEELVTLTGIFTCQGASLNYSCTVRVVPEEISDDPESELTVLVDEAESESRDSAYFHLPETFQELKIEWRRKAASEPLLLLLIGIIAGICMLGRPVQKVKQEQKQRENELLRGYPMLVMQMSLLMGAGMTAVTAWDRMVRRYREECQGGEREKQLYMEEMVITWREIRDGCGTKNAWEKFGTRIGLVPYRKFSSLLIQNMDKGTRDTAALLNQEAELVLEEQKTNAKRLGEEAGTKLLVPMMMLLLLVLLLVMIPAFMSF